MSVTLVNAFSQNTLFRPRKSIVKM